jgi:hypothetical protein
VSDAFLYVTFVRGYFEFARDLAAEDYRDDWSLPIRNDL